MRVPVVALGRVYRWSVRDPLPGIPSRFAIPTPIPHRFRRIGDPSLRPGSLPRHASTRHTFPETTSLTPEDRAGLSPGVAAPSYGTVEAQARNDSWVSIPARQRVTMPGLGSNQWRRVGSPRVGILTWWWACMSPVSVRVRVSVPSATQRLIPNQSVSFTRKVGHSIPENSASNRGDGYVLEAHGRIPCSEADGDP